MTQDLYKWEIKSIKQRYHILNLSLKQAKAIHIYEKERDNPSDKCHFSTWEEWDYEYTVFKEILNAEQFKIYDINLRQIIQRHGKTLTEEDKGKFNDIKYHTELNKYYEEKVLPSFFTRPLIFMFSVLTNDKPKIDYLKSEYKKFLSNSKKELLTNHFRFYRTFQPNALKVSLLHHQLSCLWPNYFSFKFKMDEPTKAVGNYLKNRISHISAKDVEIVKNKLEEIKKFNELNFRKYYAESKGWYVVVGKMTPEEEMEYGLMSLLLLDKSCYKDNEPL